MLHEPIPPDPQPGASENQKAAPLQPYPVGDSYINQCPDPLPTFPLLGNQAGCMFTSYWDVPVLIRRGGTNFSPTSYHPPTGFVFVDGAEQPSAFAVNLNAPREFEVDRQVVHHEEGVSSVGPSWGRRGHRSGHGRGGMESRPEENLHLAHELIEKSVP